MAAAFYGAYFASQTLGDVKTISALDDGSSAYGAYGLYDDCKDHPVKVLLYNSDYYGSNTTRVRTSEDFVLNNLYSGTKAWAVRLSGTYVDKGITDGYVPNISGLTFEDGTCKKVGSEASECYDIGSDGTLSIPVNASEAVLVYLSKRIQ